MRDASRQPARQFALRPKEDGHSAAYGPVASILRAQAAAGNQAVVRWLERGIGVHRSRRLEEEAQEFRAASRLSAAPSPGYETPPAGFREALRQGDAGKPLPVAARRTLEARFGARVDDVRVHDGGGASAIADSLGARAFAFAKDLFFGEGQYRPGSLSGDRLLAHEVSHTFQQSKGAAVIQRQGKTAAAAPDITASEILGMPAGSRMAIAQTLGELMGMISSYAPDLAASLNALSGKTATITIANDDKVEAQLDEPLKVPGTGGQPDQLIRNVKITVSRHTGAFDFTVAGSQGDGAGETILYQETDLTPKRDAGGYILAAGTQPRLRITPASGPDGAASIEVFTAPYLAGLPGWAQQAAKRVAGEKRQVLSLARLPDVRQGTTEEKKAVEKAIATFQVQAPPRQTLTAGVGVGFSRPDLLLGASWRYSFRPTRFGSLVEVPLQVDLMYSPKSEFLGSVSSGIGTSLSSLKVPVNVRLYGGVGGGSVLGDPAQKGAERPVLPAFGPVVGLGAGVEVGWFRAELRVQDLINVVGGPSVPGGFVHIGGAFQ